MNLDVYPFGFKQDLRVVLSNAQEEGVSIPDLLFQLNSYIDVAAADNTNKCPSCGKPSWAIRKFEDGVHRYWCSTCTHSEVI